MHEEYIKEVKIQEKTEQQKEIELIKNIIQAKEELKTANNNFEHAEKDLVDYYTYHIKATQAKLNYLIKIAKSKGIVSDRINEIKIKFAEQEIEAG